MNYIRGAVNAISAPYQYYKDLAPLNPSTLTGAIDVIVVQRPTDNGDSELVCSPFHVRFGKWQVLRPGEKKVNVSVNGHQIPFNMKIGEAGEAFFVFETEDDVPADLITSPLLQATELHTQQSTPSGCPQDNAYDTGDHRFGATDSGDEQDGEAPVKTEEKTIQDVQEPEFLDLDALPSPPESSKSKPTTFKRKDPTTTGESNLPSPPPSPKAKTAQATPSSVLGTDANSADERLDRAVREIQDNLHIPEVQYKDGLALDAAGYHAHGREVSEQTVRGDEFPPSASSAQTPATSRSPSPSVSPSSSTSSSHPGLPHLQSQIIHPSSSSSPTIPFPRAVSEPPPDMHFASEQLQKTKGGLRLTLPEPQQEYSWEWGAFPQPSPMVSTFSEAESSWLGTESVGQGKRGTKHKSRLPAVDSAGEEEEVSPSSDEDGDTDTLGRKKKSRKEKRSHSVPPELEGSPSRNRKGINRQRAPTPEESSEFGAGGQLSVSRGDPTRLVVLIEGRKVHFELSLVEETTKNDRIFDARDELEAARLFDDGKLDYSQVLEDDDVVNDPRLVIRWLGEQYITRRDGSPLMDALALWRNAALKAEADGIPLRPTSPEAPELQRDEDLDEASEQSSALPQPPPITTTGKPTSSSWVQWWNRSRNDAATAESSERPGLRGANSAPVVDSPNKSKASNQEPKMKPSEHVEAPSPPTPPPADHRKFAKTLRLTSDQLKSLNLKPGANTITFSLSTSGAIACTARIFVWDSTDLVLISDIDGTITKSDALGHVFTMIGRDWTHLGVAKLYTDITRNGYKIMYLTSRAIGQADATRDYLKGIKQNDYQLPEGPVIMSPDRLMASLHREVIMRKPEIFKMACLRDIQRLFGEASRNPFYAGFGNRITDALSYRSVNVPSSRIFTIDSSGEVKLELLELTGYKSSYIHMTDLVDQMFPPIHRKWAPEFTDFNYWKAPVQEFELPDLSPPSPALSARSDTSGQSTLARIRNFSLGGPSRQGTLSKAAAAAAAANVLNGSAIGEERRNIHLRQMSSFERLSSTITDFASSTVGSSGRSRSRSPEAYSSSSFTSDDEYEYEQAEDGRKRRVRRKSMTSMPGSLEENEDQEELSDEDEEEDHYEEQDGGEPEEVDFDDDLLAAGEMKNVPFL